MKWILTSLLVLASTGAMAQKKALQSGTPAKLEAINGKQLAVFLQSQKDGKLTFQPRKSTKNISVGVEKVSSLIFFLEYDEASVEKSFSEGDYLTVTSTLDPLLAPIWEYMAVENNLREAFCFLMDSNRELGKFAEVRKAANILVASGNTELEQRGQVNLALVALAENDRQTAEKIRGEITSEAAGLYLRACLERADGQPKVAIQTVTKIIANHANDIDWLAPSELLCAYLYMDMVGRNSVITTNSAMNTARQVKNMYAGTHIAADAKKFWIELGGEAIELAAEAEEAEWEARKKEAEEEKNTREKARKEAEASAETQAETEAVAETNVIATTEMESE